MIEFYKFVSQFGMRDASPFCLKLMTYLRLAEIPHHTHEILDPRKAPKAKMPFIIDDGARMGDSEIIIRHLKETFGDLLGEGLSDQQKAISHAFNTLLAERFYWTIIHTRWTEPKFQPLLQDAWFTPVPKLVRGVVARLAFKQVAKASIAQGMGRHSLEEIHAFAIADIDAIAVMLGDKDYFFDDQPREIDASIYAFLSVAKCDAFPTPIRDHIMKSQRLLDYLDRVDQAAYGSSENMETA